MLEHSCVSAVADQEELQFCSKTPAGQTVVVDCSPLRSKWKKMTHRVEARNLIN